jgi:2-polyprenyl-3-methyl-5-hydroxy-6-metoxy-1,4-benzoquinol methylase
MQDRLTFAFGENWQSYLEKVDGQSYRNAESSITEFMGLGSLRGKSFVDIGCGSGLFSFAAYGLGAERIVSFDVDPRSADCCKKLHQRAGSPANWEVHTGSILDSGFVSALGQFDIVYSWGVLHHTGRMWEAIRNSASLVNRGGSYYIAIYNNVGGIRGSQTWLKIKKLYNRSPKAGKHFLETAFILGYFAGDLVRFKNPIATIKNYKQNRGMNWRTDIIDWLGGYPYEFATVEEVFRFVKREFPDFELSNIQTTNGIGTNRFLFQKASGQ